MRMHRGSSKGTDPPGSVPESLPLSASPGSLEIVVEFLRPPGAPARALRLPAGSTVGDAVRAVGRPLEGSAVLVEGRPVPLDEPVAPRARLVLISTFSGG